MTALARVEVPADAPVALARASLAANSKSFALAGKLLPASMRDDAAVLYAWCRRCDDAIDLAPAETHAVALAGLVRELDAIYGTRVPGDPITRAMQDVVRRYELPRAWPEALIAGVAMDAAGRRYATVDDLLDYCHCVAGVVGLMMARLMGVRNEATLARAHDLGVAMQLTNVARDVDEDWGRGRLYLPDELMGGATIGQLDRARAGRAVERLLAIADERYRSADVGIRALPLRFAIGIRTARLVYSAIGGVVARRRYDVTAGRAVVPRWRKLWLAARAAAGELFRRMLP